MGNMSYCRFENTVGDLQDCYYAMCEGSADHLGEREERAKQRLLKLCKKITEEFPDE